jgi:hypothetical protein|tara:strand:+ start:2620 stop:4029 length:1410 start_codon:yes stop_codon:yes gene_type:complete
MLHFYDGQIRRYITQVIRLLSGFTYKDGDGALRRVPVAYGDLNRQVAHILRDNSENKLPSAPRMAVYMTAMELDRARLSDSSYVNKVNVRERAYDSEGNEYLNTQGKNYTVERLMPTPYILTMNVDIWTSNTEQKLQIMEQLLVMFNPSLEIQTTDNYVDWTSLTVVNLDNINFSNKTIPVGTDSEIDVATLIFSTPIYISPPAKVKRLGVITNVLMGIYDESKGTIVLNNSTPQINQYNDSIQTGKGLSDSGNSIAKSSITDKVIGVNYQQYGLYILAGSAQLVKNGVVGQINWRGVLEATPGTYQAGISRVYATRVDTGSIITGSFALNELDETRLIVDWDQDSFSTNTVISGRSSIDYIIDPQRTVPDTTPGTRLLLLDNIGSTTNTSGPTAWKNSTGTDFVASENDIVEYDGNNWSIVLNASETADVVYTQNLATGIQYMWDGIEWSQSVDGFYPVATWRLDLDG